MVRRPKAIGNIRVSASLISRWVVLTFQRELMWFDKVVSPENINAANSHAVINLNDAQIEKHPTVCAASLLFSPSKKSLCFKIISGSGQTATFFPPDEYSYQDWFQEIIGASGGEFLLGFWLIG